MIVITMVKVLKIITIIMFTSITTKYKLKLEKIIKMSSQQDK